MSGSGVVREMTRTRKTEAAYTNEQITRQRVDALERIVKEHDMLLLNDQNLAKWLSGGFGMRLVWLIFGVDWNMDRGFWGRLSWLLRGR